MGKRETTITAEHPAFGTVRFTFRATDAKEAFATWKQIVFSARQWRVTENTGCREAVPANGDSQEPVNIDDI